MKKQIFNLLNQKHELLQKVFKYVSSKNFKVSEDEDEVERILNYLEAREKMFLSIAKIEEELKKVSYNTEIKEKYIDEIKEKNDNIINKILEIDSLNKKKMEEILEIFKTNIKAVKRGINANNGYFGFYNTSSKGSLFDISR